MDIPATVRNDKMFKLYSKLHKLHILVHTLTEKTVEQEHMAQDNVKIMVDCQECWGISGSGGRIIYRVPIRVQVKRRTNDDRTNLKNHSRPEWKHT